MKITLYFLLHLIIVCFESPKSLCIKLSNSVSLLTDTHVFLVILASTYISHLFINEEFKKKKLNQENSFS
jgi:hypothetical protein